MSTEVSPIEILPLSKWPGVRYIWPEVESTLLTLARKPRGTVVRFKIREGRPVNYQQKLVHMYAERNDMKVATSQGKPKPDGFIYVRLKFSAVAPTFEATEMRDMWRCIKCGTPRAWGNGGKKREDEVRLRCSNCSGMTSHGATGELM